MEKKDYMRIAYQHAAKYSTDPSTQTGVIIVNGKLILIGDANHQPLGITLTEERKQRPKKYNFIEHAERNIIAKAARNRISLINTTMYSPWFPCSDCMRAIINAGIKELICHKDLEKLCEEYAKEGVENAGFWNESQRDAYKMMKEAGLVYEEISGKIGDCKILFQGKIFEP